MRVFLAGATGVIGTPLVPQMLEAGHQVTAMTRSVLRAAQLEAARELGCQPRYASWREGFAASLAYGALSPEQRPGFRGL
jgi:uncharacterized protein YbjT (DUF2867 family)